MPRYDKENKKIAALLQKIELLEATNSKLITEKQRVDHALYGALHEIRRFSSEINNNSETLAKRLSSKGDENARELANTIFYTSGMISARLGLTDLELNPAAIGRQSMFKSGLYKKFEKAKYVLATRAKSRRINIRFHGNSYLEIEALPAFELVPFLILDNALKYSPSGGEVNVYYGEYAADDRTVRVESLGPLVEKDELEKIFSRGFRGKNSGSFGGEGLGLYLAKFLCDYHNVDISAASEPENAMGSYGTPLGVFALTMRLNLE